MTNGGFALSGTREPPAVLKYATIIEVKTMKKLPNIHPGEVLREEFLVPLGISQYRLAKEIRVPEPRISAICNGKRAITADTAVRLSRFFGTSAGFWLGLQADYDTEEIEKAESESLSAIHMWSVAVQR
jgi:addiction module HigA family antidote